MSTTDPSAAESNDEPTQDAGQTAAYESIAVEPAGAEADAPVTDAAASEPAGDAAAEASAAAEQALASDPDETEVAPAAQPQRAPEEPVVAETVAYVAPVPNDAYPAPQPIYVQAPVPPATKGNRGFGILVGLVSTVVFAGIYALAGYLIGLALNGVDKGAETFTQFVSLPVFYVPVIFFFLAFALVAAVINRAGWWSWVLGAFFIGLIAYFSYIGASLLTVHAWEKTPTEAAQFLSQQWLHPLAIAVFVIAREVPIWFGAWSSSHGRTVSARNVAARQEYDRMIAEGPQLHRP